MLKSRLKFEFLAYLFDSFEHVPNRAWQDTRLALGPEHRVGLARGGLAIHEDGAIEAIESLPHDWLDDLVVDLGRSSLGPVALIEVELLLLGDLVESSLQLALTEVDTE